MPPTVALVLKLDCVTGGAALLELVKSKVGRYVDVYAMGRGVLRLPSMTHVHQFVSKIVNRNGESNVLVAWNRGRWTPEIQAVARYLVGMPRNGRVGLSVVVPVRTVSGRLLQYAREHVANGRKFASRSAFFRAYPFRVFRIPAMLDVC